MKLSEIASTLREIRVTPVKTLGQNFLHDQNLGRWIVAQANLTPDDYVVEIGPGLGALTEFILATGAQVLAIEKDARLAEFLSVRFRNERLEVWHGDALEFDVRTLLAKPRVKLLGNLPYNIASQLLFHYLETPTPFSLVILMLQKEMAERLSATPSTKNYGALTLQLQFHYRIKYLRTIPASVFIPAPEIDSATVLLQPREAAELPDCDFGTFINLVRIGFSQRRKQLGKLLREETSDWVAIASRLGVDARVRAEALALPQWVELTNSIRPTPDVDRQKMDSEQFSVVDEADRVTGSAPRGQVHGDNLRHRAVHVLIFNEIGDIFLQKRSRWKDRHPLVWDSSAAGHVNAGEEYDFAATRELKEELGIDVPLERMVKLPASDRTGQEFIWLYRGRYNGAFTLERSEIETGAFFPPAVVTGWIAARPGDFAPGFVECWKAYRALGAV